MIPFLSLLPLLPELVRTVVKVVEAIRSDPDVPADVRAQLDALSADLQAVNAKVQSAVLPPEGSGG